MLGVLQVATSLHRQMHYMVVAGAIEPLTALLDSRRPVSAIRTVVLLHDIAASRQQHKEAIIAAGNWSPFCQPDVMSDFAYWPKQIHLTCGGGEYCPAILRVLACWYVCPGAKQTLFLQYI